MPQKQPDPYSMEAMVTKHYKKIMLIAQHKAFRFNINKNDLISKVNEKMAVAIKHKLFSGESDAQFFAYMNRIMHNTAICHLRNNPITFIDISDISECDCLHVVTQGNFEMKDFTKLMVNFFKNECKNKRFKEIFNLHFIGQLSYEETAAELGIPLGTVKTGIFKIRELANKKFGNQYEYLMAS